MLCAAYATYMAYNGVKGENKKSTETYLQSSGFISFLLLTTAFFDMIAIVDSQSDNTSHCNFEHGSHLRDIGALGDYINCSFMLYYLIVVLGMVSGTCVYYSNKVMANFKKTIAIDGL